jgi:pimeloyl-ACP methyl ester carboxylesterase
LPDGLLTAGKIALIVVIGFPLLMYFAQDSLIFHPQPLADAQRAALAGRGGVESVFLDADGVRLHAWYVKGEPLVLYFGGNAEEVSWMLEDSRQRTPGMGWLLVDYRGYGASGGKPSEAALVADALKWYDRFPAQKTYVFGRSLGSGVAVQLAAQRPVAGVVLVTPYDSMVAVGKHHYPYLPVDWLLKHRFDSIALAPKIAAPLLCIVATRDNIVPMEHGKRLYDAWAGPKRWLALEEAGHNSTDAHPLYWSAILAFLQK